LPSYVAAVTKIVSKDMLDGAVLPSSVTVNSVSPVYSCRVGTYRTNPAPVARVTASLTLSIPLAALFQNFVTIPTTITTTVSGETRVFGT
jgi:hypothetical protein